LRPCGFTWHIPAEAIWAVKFWLCVLDRKIRNQESILSRKTESKCYSARKTRNSRTLKTDSYNLIEENGAKILFCIFGWVTKGKNIKIENVTE
jgi:hypothetical protein